MEYTENGGKVALHIKTWEELTISDNFLFQKVMLNPELCREFLKKLLHIRIKRIIYSKSEQVIELSVTQKGSRLDIYVELEDGTIIDIEMQTTNKSLAWLPQRMRYYQAMVDLNTLGKGKDYTALKPVYIIFICTFDPFPHCNRKVYTFTSRCKEQNTLEMGDNTTKIFLNTKGTVGKVNQDIDNFLAYIDGAEATGKFTKDIEREVERVKQHDELRVEYMSMMAEMMDQRREGRFDNLLANIKTIMEKLSYTAESAMDFLDVPLAERDALRASL